MWTKPGCARGPRQEEGPGQGPEVGLVQSRLEEARVSASGGPVVRGGVRKGRGQKSSAFIWGQAGGPWRVLEERRHRKLEPQMDPPWLC